MTTSVANPFTSFSFYNRKRRHREGNGFTHSHTALSGRAGVWMQAEVTVSHTVLPISSEAPAPPLGSSHSPFFGCKSGGPESEVTYPLSRSRRGLRSDSIPGLFTPLLPQTPPRNTPASELGGGNVHTLAMTEEGPLLPPLGLPWKPRDTRPARGTGRVSRAPACH